MQCAPWASNGPNHLGLWYNARPGQQNGPNHLGLRAFQRRTRSSSRCSCWRAGRTCREPGWRREPSTPFHFFFRRCAALPRRRLRGFPLPFARRRQPLGCCRWEAEKCGLDVTVVVDACVGHLAATQVRTARRGAVQQPRAHVHLFSLWRTLPVRIPTRRQCRERPEKPIASTFRSVRVLTGSILPRENKRVWARSRMASAERSHEARWSSEALSKTVAPPGSKTVR